MKIYIAYESDLEGSDWLEATAWSTLKLAKKDVKRMIAEHHKCCGKGKIPFKHGVHKFSIDSGKCIFKKS